MQASVIRTIGVLVICAHAVVSSDGGDQVPRKLYPIDVARKDPGLARLRDDLIEAARRMDPQRLRTSLAESLNVDYDTVSRDAFLGRLQRGQPEDARDFWHNLLVTLRLGLTHWKDRPMVCAPYVFTELGPYIGEEAYYAVTGAGVRMRERPALSARVIDVLAYDVVRQGPAGKSDHTEIVDGYPSAWRNIVTPAGKSGWALDAYLRYPHDSRFCFERVNGEWKLTVILMTGD
jgi:hypothetical protein